MTGTFAFVQDGVGAAYHHVPIQSTYVRSGMFLVTSDGAGNEFGGGNDLMPAPPLAGKAVRGCSAHEATSLVDTFTPRPR